MTSTEPTPGPPVGAFARRTRTVTGRDIELFTEITGDRNPIHYDAELAARSRFGGIVVQGGVTSGLLNALVAEQLPGPGSVFLEVAWRFLAPVRPGDVITAEATVTARPGGQAGHHAGHPDHQPGRRRRPGRHRRRLARPRVAGALREARPRKPNFRASITSPRRATGTNHGGTMTITAESPNRNGVDTATLFATLDAVKGADRDRRSSSSAPATPG